MTLTQGQILNQRYRIVKLLGQGGFGEVYKAWDLNFEVVCAIKENFETSAEAQRQFLREARLLHVLRHPNLPLVKDHFVIPGQGQYLVMDFVEGQDLEELRTAAGGKLPQAQVLPWIAQVCEALDYLHRQSPPVIHRDLKPANIKITPEGRAMLVDFGIAKTYDPHLKTTLGARAVTPGYSPIEQYGTGVTDARTDIYSLGATLYTLLTGQEPPEAPQRVVRDPLVAPGRLNPAIAPEIEAALLRALQVDTEQRFQSAGEFKTALSRQMPATGKPPAAVVTQPPTTLPFAPAVPAPSPRPAGQGRVGGGVSSFPWKWVGIGAGVLVGLALLAVGAGLALKGAADNRATQTAQARGSQTVAALDAGQPQTPTLLLPTSTLTFTVIPPTHTPTPSPLPPSPTPLEDFLISSADGMVLRYIPAGTFQMGEDADRALEQCQLLYEPFTTNTCSRDLFTHEEPVHTVTLDPFWMDQTEVTNAMYAVFLNAMGNQSEGVVPWLDADDGDVDIHQQDGQWVVDAGRETHPVIEVSWYGAAAYCDWAGRELPTEAQWEYAARGELAGALYPWGDTFDGALANFCDENCSLDWSNPNYDDDYVDTAPVGSYPANGYGLNDMAGNVWEWVADWYGADYYSSSPVENPAGPASGDYRARRGGSWYSVANALRVSSRVGSGPGDTYDNVGFRCARSPYLFDDAWLSLSPDWSDPMDTSTNWHLLDTANTRFTMDEGRLRMTVIQPGGGEEWGLSSHPAMDDYYLQATFITGDTCADADRYGVLVRAPDADQGYVYGFSCNGRYRIYAWDGSTYRAIQEWRTSSVIRAGANQTNILGIWLSGETIRLYANGQVLAEFTDDQFDSGQFGLFIGSPETSNFTVYVDEFSAWDLND